jgi:hypothetical protein
LFYLLLSLALGGWIDVRMSGLVLWKGMGVKAIYNTLGGFAGVNPVLYTASAITNSVQTGGLQVYIGMI